MSIVRVGTNSKYANGWEAAFGGKKAAKTAAAKKAAGKPAKKSAKKKAKK